MQYLICGLIGLFGGVAGGLFGVGGGIVMVPAMIMFLKLDPKTAIGTSLAVIVFTAVAGSVQHWRLQNIDWRLVMLLVPTAILGGVLGAQLTEALSSANLKRGFGCLLLLAAARLLFSR